MKVKIEFTLDIDVDAWMTDYGLTADEVRDDVRAYAKQTVTEHFRDQGYLTDGGS
jgi:hypothetical protein